MIELQETASLVQAIEQQLGRELLPQVQKAFLGIPRHLFIEQYYKQQGNSLSWDLVPATYEHIYKDEALVTQLDERGMPTSSSSQPSLMSVQLEALAVRNGQRLLEIGTGTGYNAALMAVLVGETGQIISIDTDESLMQQARRNIEQAEVSNVLALVGDGFLGCPDYAPYDGILATCSIRSIPHPWFDQLKQDGTLVCNWLTNLTSLFVCVKKISTNALDGTFLDLDGMYMEMRENHASAKYKEDWKRYDAQPQQEMSSPGLKALLKNPAYSLLLQCQFPTMRKRYRSKDDQIHLYLTTQETAILVEDDTIVTGAERIGQQIQQSILLYQQLGHPGIKEYCVTFQKDSATVRIGDRCYQLAL